jgi:hypothetical protein
MPGSAGSDIKLGFYVGLGILGALLVIGLAQTLLARAKG